MKEERNTASAHLLQIDEEAEHISRSKIELFERVRRLDSRVLGGRTSEEREIQKQVRLSEDVWESERIFTSGWWILPLLFLGIFFLFVLFRYVQRLF